ncbi:MAG: hypothetical protein KA120_09080 [Candidatus Goldbacteria bacterium]|nr:hypothetical protein [Candidatus Goldiibacteriota bacterium]HPD19192.1 hypothetical protein [Candidatus Goldiibacteriota bacterium]
MQITNDVFGDKIEYGEYMYFRKDRTACCKLTNWDRLSAELKSDFNEKPEAFQLSLR